jgi:hypothetical protein
LPEYLKHRILTKAHDDMFSEGHSGFKRKARKILQVFYMSKKQIKAFVSLCETCQRKNEGAEFKITAIEVTFGEKWCIDVMGGELNRLSRKDGNYKYALVCVEAVTRWAELVAMPSLTAKNLASATEINLIARFDCKTLVYDQQSGLMGHRMQTVLKLLRINSVVAVAGYHAATAVAERYVRTVETCLKSYLPEYMGRLDKILPWIAFQLRQSLCETLGWSAHELTFGYNFPDQLH